jgi:4-hydroxy-tetrahydrodipicolinate synthase
MNIPHPQAPFGPLVTAMVTPFNSQLELDLARVEPLVEHLVSTGSTGLVVTGTTGESPTLTPDEKLELYRTVKNAANGRVPIIANTGDNETSFSIEFSRRAQQTGVDALLLVVPYYNRPSQEGLYRHFKAIAESVELPCILYNVPTRTARNMEAETVARLAQIPNIVGTKEASGDMAQIAKIRATTPDDFWIYSGNDNDTYPMLALGGCGVISVASHIAGREIAEMMRAFWAGDLAHALELHLRLVPLVEALFPASCPSPAPVKAGLALQGLDCGGLRLPLVEAGPNDREAVRVAMVEAGVL